MSSIILLNFNPFPTNVKYSLVLVLFILTTIELQLTLDRLTTVKETMLIKGFSLIFGRHLILKLRESNKSQ
jgi:hypothetical protein